MTFQNITTFLQEFSRQHQLKKEAFKSCEEVFKNCSQQDLGGFTRNEILVNFSSHYFIFDHNYNHQKFPFVRTRLYLYDKATYSPSFKSTIGYYDLDTSMDGEHFDDWLVITEEKQKTL